MISSNNNKIGDKKIKNKVGGDANESRFFSTTRELRKHKVVISPSVNTNSFIKLEQGWNNKAKQKDVVRVTIDEVSVITEREFLEQAIATLAQGNEVIKYNAPKG